MRNRYVLGLLGLLIGSPCAHLLAQVPVLLSRLPAANAVAVPRAATVQLNFSQPMSAQAASASAINVTSGWRGRIAGTFSGAGTSTVSFTPARALLPGEPVHVNATVRTTSQAGTALAAPMGYQFRATAVGGTGLFPTPPDVALASTPTNAVAGDVNGDGLPDLLTTINSSSNAGTVNVRLSNGQGGFSSSSDVPVGNRPVAVVVADVNRDGRLDFLTANLNANTVSVRLGDGMGGFSGTGGIAVGTAPAQIALGDFNADGNLDFVTVSGTANTISLRLGDGQGGFAAPGTPLRAEIPVGITPVDVSVGDVNRDGNLDIVTINNSNNGNTVTTSVRFGNGQGAFTGTANAPLTNDPTSLLLADVSGDGILDLLMPSVGRLDSRGTVSIRVGNGQGSFSGTLEVAVGRDPVRAVLGDVNGDGRLDLLTANRNFFYPSGTVSIRLGTAQGGFTGVTDLTVGTGPSALAVGDVNRDGRVDLLTTSYIRNLTGGNSTSTIASVRLGNGRGSFEGPSEIEVGNGSPINTGGDVSDVTVADVNNDGQLDMLTANVNANTVSVRLGDGRGQFVAAPEVPVGIGALSVAVGDVNGDGNLDLLAANAGFAPTYGNTVSVRLGDGRGGFSGSLEVAVGAGPIKVVVGDINGDGNLDFVTANYPAFSVSIRLGNGQGGFVAVPDVALIGRAASVALGDVNSDGKSDLLVADYDYFTIRIRLGNGAGSFTGTSSVSVGSQGGTPVDLVLGDVNNDGNLDVLTANVRTQSATGTVSVRLGNGQGSFAGTTEVPVTLDTQRLALGDVNGDGNLDFVSSDINTSAVSVHPGNGMGAFGAGANVPTGVYPRTVALADLDGDGDLDILAACYESGNVSVRLNAGLGMPLATTPPKRLDSNSPLAVFPNPAHSSAKLVNALPGGTAVLYDMQGRQVRIFTTSGTLDLANLPKGLYLIRSGAQAVRLEVE